MKNNKTAAILILVLLAGCKSPFDRTKDASGGGGTGTLTGGTNFVVFSSELKTGGGAFFYPGGENQALTFSDNSNPISDRSIRYVWNGQDVSSQFGPEHTFAGFDLMHTPLQADYLSTPGRDLRPTNYGHVKFFARGSLGLNTFVKVEVADDGNTGTAAPCISLSSTGLIDDGVNPGSNSCLSAPGGQLGTLSGNWSSFTIPISNSNLNGLKDFFKATLILNQPGGGTPGSGGTVYFDQIEYTP